MLEKKSKPNNGTLESTQLQQNGEVTEQAKNMFLVCLDLENKTLVNAEGVET